MTRRQLGLAVLALALAVPLTIGGDDSASRVTYESTGRGSVERLVEGYRDWERAQARQGLSGRLVVGLAAPPALVTRPSAARGVAVLDLATGAVSVDARGLPAGEWDVWLVRERPEPGRSLLPRPGDETIRVGRLVADGGRARVRAPLDPAVLDGLPPDLVVVSAAGRAPAADRALVGVPSLFERLAWTARQGRFGRLALTAPTPRPARGWFAAAEAQIGPIPNPTTALELLITEGRRLFLSETFAGNGRTCGSCHRERNNLTIDPAFIATLPPNDPLFVAETMPALSQNFENPVLMRGFGLVLLNPDGFDDLADKFVMRGVPHTLAMLPNTLRPAELDETHPPFTPVPPLERTGWGGDGAPGTGTLREFLIGAIAQYLPRTLNRVAGVDFRLPAIGELDAVEAFLKSTGRRADLALAGPGALSLRSPVARRGQQVFNNPGTLGGLFTGPSQGAGRCLLCHFNAGSGDFFESVLLGGPADPAAANGAAMSNGNFDTGVEDLPSQPARLVVPAQKIPADGGFGRDAIFRNGVFIGFGNGLASPSGQRTFNTPVLVEAADTPPFFHNNSISTIEGAVAFYTSAAFNNSPIGQVLASLDPGGVAIRLEATEVEAVAAFLRVINALENIRSAVDLATRARAATGAAQAGELIDLAISELEDAITVLRGAGLHAPTQGRLAAAQEALMVAARRHGDRRRDRAINEALVLMTAARGELAQ